MSTPSIVLANSHHPVVAPLKALWRWLMADPGELQGSSNDDSRTNPTCGASSRKHLAKVQPCSKSHVGVPSRPLRVLQVRETGQAPAQAGRIRISGRMADVCAELDRLAACEARLH